MKVESLVQKEHLHINTSRYASREGYSLKVINMLGMTLYETDLIKEEYEIDLNRKTISGNIFLEILDQDGNIIDIMKVK